MSRVIYHVEVYLGSSPHHMVPVVMHDDGMPPGRVLCALEQCALPGSKILYPHGDEIDEPTEIDEARAMINDTLAEQARIWSERGGGFRG